MKNNNTVEACTHCHVCQNQCEFLKKYGIDIGDTEKLKELSYHSSYPFPTYLHI